MYKEFSIFLFLGRALANLQMRYCELSSKSFVYSLNQTNKRKSYINVEGRLLGVDRRICGFSTFESVFLILQKRLYAKVTQRFSFFFLQSLKEYGEKNIFKKQKTAIIKNLY